MIPQILYTNSKCKDIWQIFYDQNQKYYQGDVYVITDSNDFLNVPQEKIYQYKQEEPYYKAWINALKKFNLKTFIYLQEDFILYDAAKTNILLKYHDYLINNDKYSFVRLIKSGHNLSNNRIYENLFEIGWNSFPLYSMQPSIWKTEAFIKLYEQAKQEKWFECEEYETPCKDLNIYGLYHFNNENARGGHFDSSVYPYIATAIVKGKWNISEYEKELVPLFLKYNVNTHQRGIC